MALQPNTGPGLPFRGFVTITFLQGWIVSPTPNLEDQASVFMTPGDRMTQLYPQARRQDDPAIPPGTGYPILVAFYDMQPQHGRVCENSTQATVTVWVVSSGEL
jgi:hypothetical protein